MKIFVIICLTFNYFTFVKPEKSVSESESVSVSVSKSESESVLKSKSNSVLKSKSEAVSKSKSNTNKFNSNTHDKTIFRLSLLKSFARNLMDTKLLKITSNLNLRGKKYNQYTENTQNLKNENENKNQNENQGDDEVILGSVIRDTKTGEMSFHRVFFENVLIQNTKKLIARARYNKSLNKIGWSKLFVETFDNAPPEMITWAAGFLEGKLTAPQILDFYNNLVGIHEKESQYLEEVFKYYENVEKFIRRKTNKDSLENIKDMKDLDYWISVAMTQAQSDGLLQGYNSIMKNNQLNFSQIYFINADGEVPELLNVFKYKKRNFKGTNYSFREKKLNKKKVETEKFSKAYLKEVYGSEDPEIVWEKIMSKSHCSAIIKLITDENNNPSDIFVGHSTWDSYSEMHRIFKKYKFSYTMYETETKNSEISFSSYPGTLTSTDDFYLLNKNIVVLETTLEMLNKDIYEKNMPNSNSHVPNYIRISVANRLANSAKEWTEIFKLNNGGTYNSQWMIIDYERFNNIIKNNPDLLNQKHNQNQNQNQNQNKFTNNNTSNNNNNIMNMKFFNRAINNSLNNNNSNYNYNENNNNFNTQNLSKQKYLTDLSLFDTLDKRENSDVNLNWFRFKQSELKYYENGNGNNNLEYSGVFFLLEQVPGYIETKDMTNLLFNKGFWGSYNRPYFQKIYFESGYYEMSKKYGKTYSYYDNPRAILINHEIKNVRDMNDMKNLMQNNSNPFNKNNHMNVISPRYDMVDNLDIRRTSGGIDSKIVNLNLVKHGGVLAISGPSKQNGIKPFDWRDYPDEPHNGLPDVWDFEWNLFDENFIKN
jgi:hypothetical protein